MTRTECCLLLALLVAVGCTRNQDGSAKSAHFGKTEAEECAAQKATGAISSYREDVQGVFSDSLNEIRLRIASLDLARLQAWADHYAVIILEKAERIADLTARLRETPMAEAMSEKARVLKEQLATYTAELEELKARYVVYYQQAQGTYRPAGIDLTGNPFDRRLTGFSRKAFFLAGSPGC